MLDMVTVAPIRQVQDVRPVGVGGVWGKQSPNVFPPWESLERIVSGVRMFVGKAYSSEAARLSVTPAAVSPLGTLGTGWLVGMAK